MLCANQFSQCETATSRALERPLLAAARISRRVRSMHPNAELGLP